MSSQAELLALLERSATRSEKTSDAYDEVLTSEGEKDVTLSDGTKTPNLNKRIKTYGGQVTSVVGKIGDVTIQDISEKLELGSASKYNVADLPATQKQRNEFIGNVDSIEALKNFSNPKNGNVIFVKSHYSGLNLGSGFYQFEQLSTKQDNEGAWVSSLKSSGVWVLISDLHFENFGVIEGDEDQSDKIQKCLDFMAEQNIFSVSYERSKTYSISKSIIFKPLKNSDVSTFYSTEKKLTVKTNGSKLKKLNGDFPVYKIHREHVYIDHIECFSDVWSKGSVVVQIGLSGDEEYGNEYRRSASFFSTDSISATNFEHGLHFKPGISVNGSSYGCYYHQIGDIVFRNVTNGLVFDVSADGRNQTTRTNIKSYLHNGGAVAFLGLNCESVSINSFNVENLNDSSLFYPQASKFGVYIPEKGDGMSFSNHSIVINGATEDVPYPIHCYANNCEIKIYPGHLDTGASKLNGQFNSGYGGVTANPVCLDPSIFVFPYGSSKMASLAIHLNSAGAAHLPPGLIELYGNIQWLPCASQLTIEGVQVINSRYPHGIWTRTTNGTSVENTTFGEWLRIDKQSQIDVNRALTNVDCNTLVSDGEKTFSVDIDSSTSNSPTGGEFYGAIKWIPTLGSEGFQLAYGTYPNVNKKRIKYTNSWSAWFDL